MRMCYRFILLSVLLGCQTTPEHPSAAGHSTGIMFISFPPGAHIEIDREYKGRTPNIIELNEHRSGGNYEIFIYPSQADLYCTQYLSLDPRQIPQQVVVDLTKCPAGAVEPSL